METQISITFYRYARLGDCILVFQPILWLVREYPNIQINFVTSKSIVSAFSHRLDTVNFIECTQNIKAIREQLKTCKSNFLIDLQSNPRSRWLTFRMRNEFQVVRYSKNTINRYKLVYLKLAEEIEVKHRIQAYFEALEKVLVVLNLPQKAALKFQSLVVESQKCRKGIALCIGAHYDTKKATASAWGNVIKSNLNEVVYLIGLESDLDMAYQLIHQNPNIAFINLVNKLNLNELTDLLGSLSRCFTNDSATTHLSELCGTPVVVLYGPTTTQFGFAPMLQSSEVLLPTIACSPCSTNGDKSCKFSDKRCFESYDLGKT